MITNKKTLETKNYLQTLEDLKSKIKTAQIKAHLAVNKEMLILYWQIGKTIIKKQKKEGWGTKIIERLANDLSSEFKNMKGLSKRNLEFMQQFAFAYQNIIPKQLVSEIPLPPIFNIPWGHNIVIIQKIDDIKERLWYANQTIKNGWSRNVLANQINSNLYKRQAVKEIKSNNFAHTLQIEQSEVLQELIKDEYNLEFIHSNNDLIKERKVENAIINNIVKFLTELGKGFAFFGKQYHLEVANQNFYIDLLFYHIKLKSYVLIELKTTKFKPEYAGKMGFYLSCIDDYLKDKNDNSSIGIILCQDGDKDHEIREKSLQCMIKPIGISNYTISHLKLTFWAKYF